MRVGAVLAAPLPTAKAEMPIESANDGGGIHPRCNKTGEEFWAVKLLIGAVRDFQDGQTRSDDLESSSSLVVGKIRGVPRQTGHRRGGVTNRLSSGSTTLSKGNLSFSHPLARHASCELLTELNLTSGPRMLVVSQASRKRRRRAWARARSCLPDRSSEMRLGLAVQVVATVPLKTFSRCAGFPSSLAHGTPSSLSLGEVLFGPRLARW